MDSGAVAFVEFEISTAGVHVWHQRRRVGTLHRASMLRWLSSLSVEVALSSELVALNVTTGGAVMLTLPGVTQWRLTLSQVAVLRHCLQS